MTRTAVRWLPRGTQGYWTSAVCSAGHVVVSAKYDPCQIGPEVPHHCSQCGSEVVAACPGCGHSFRDRERPSTAPNFCTACSTAFPWASAPMPVLATAAEVPSSGNRRRFGPFGPLLSLSVNNSQIAVGGVAVAQTRTVESDATAAPKNRFTWVGPLITAVGGLFKGTVA